LKHGRRGGGSGDPARRPASTSAGRAQPAGVSLPRALSKLGFCSRSQGEALVRAGRVRVDGVVVSDPAVRVDMARVKLAVDRDVVAAERRVYLMLNKPRGVVTTRVDPAGRATVYGCIAALDVPFVSPVGRLDRDSDGLLLMTNDTQWAQRLLDPASHVPKVYHVRIDRVPDDALLARIHAGVEDRGERLGVQSARVLRTEGRGAWLEIVLDEGRNRHIRRLLAALGVGISRLHRSAMGPLTLGDLPAGQARELTAAEAAALGGRRS
jgi:23S rRNA pseudouridine2605 synthase